MKGPCCAPAADAASLPLTATIAGVAVVTIPLAEYAELLECRQLGEVLRGRAQRLAPLSRSPFRRDLEVADFLAERLGKKTLAAILTECRHCFGPERTPSSSAAHRYWKRLRAAS